ncbi:MAG: hypothetical protein PHG13_00660 [Candidatus Pacebacteria bacterium]|jgi:predicted DNA-binding protein with PD1-like motif|nr:hypothetical protein [Candidatus Paceibacterota bacterium]MDD3491475.1 hypothetical protein [Candidatus Paceibacterota bacterium]MDD5722028.1 hypothetical protein [Candidatus Paceibacterota bacterium]
MILLSFRANGNQFEVKVEKGEDLLIALDKLFKKHRIGKESVSNWQLNFSKEKSIISKRIAQSIVNALKFTA